MEGFENLSGQPSREDEEDARTWADDWWRSGHVAAKLSHEFGEKVIALGVVFTFEQKPDFKLFSGVLLRIGPGLFWLTARHVIDHLLELRDADSVRIHNVSWHDDYTNKNAASVPMSLDELPAYRDPKLDFGAVVIRPGYAEPLLANPGVCPITPKAWYHHEMARPEGFYIVGYPEACCDLKPVGRNGKGKYFIAGASLVCLPMERIERQEGADPADFWGHPDALYGKLIPFSEGDARESRVSIKGMSGGPLLSIERDPDDRLLFRLFGIQSAWLPESRIVRVVPIRSVVEAMTGWFQRARSED